MNRKFNQETGSQSSIVPNIYNFNIILRLQAFDDNKRTIMYLISEALYLHNV